MTSPEHYDVSPDGSRLLMLVGVDDQRSVVVYDWAAELRNRLRTADHPEQR